MKKAIYTITIIIVFFAQAIGQEASINPHAEAMLDYADNYMGEDDEEETSNKETVELKMAADVINAHVIRAKKISSTFTGYKVQLFNSIEPITEGHVLFNDFGKITFETTDHLGYAYTVGSFKSETIAQEYVEKIIGNRYEAVVVKYENGQRVAAL